MDASQHYALSSLEAGRRPEDVVRSLMDSGWPPDAAWHLVKTVQPPRQPDPRLWMVIVSFALGLVFVLVDVIMFFALFAEPGGPRGVLAQFTDGRMPVGVWVAVTLPLWVISAVLIIVHTVLSRREPRVPRQGRSLAVFSWILVIGNPILAVATAVVTVVVFGALGIMCGEAVSADCGM